ncbi:hypothetical protein RUND412_006049 [Rhizina undulata]
MQSQVIKICMIRSQILHRDISINNIMILHNPKPGEPKGFLIELDFCKDLNTSGSQPVEDHRTGTPEFMAIEIL